MFAWGPAGGGELKETGAIEFAISVDKGGKGSVWTDGLQFEKREPVRPYELKPVVRVSTLMPSHGPDQALDHDPATFWESGELAEEQWLLIDFLKNREYGGLVIDWDAENYATAYQVQISELKLVHTLKSTLAYILINHDGPAIQPGSRNYSRSWIWDGALTSAALLEMGYTEEVRDFIKWYARHQFADGKIPCCVDHRGPNPVAEHDSHGEFIYLLMDYYRHTRDVGLLNQMWPQAVKAVEYIDSLRQQRLSETFKTPEKQPFYGIMPESISHEGYASRPVHAYWDDFWTLRGLKDTASMATIIGDEERDAHFAGLSFVRSVRSMFVYEDESDKTLVIAAGFPAAWIENETGITLKRLSTYYGTLNYSLRKGGLGELRLKLSGDIALPPGKIIVTSPLEEPLKGVLVNGKPSATFNAHRATVDEFPAEVVLQYSHYQAVTKSIHRRKNLIFFNRLDAVLIA